MSIRLRALLADPRSVPPLADQVRVFRRFEHVFERRLRAAYRAALAMEMSTAEMEILRVMGEIGIPVRLAWIRWKADLDGGYACRTLKVLTAWGRVTRCGREYELTPEGQQVYRALERFHDERVTDVLEALPLRQRRRLVAGMSRVLEVLARSDWQNAMEMDDEPRRKRWATLCPGPRPQRRAAQCGQ